MMMMTLCQKQFEQATRYESIKKERATVQWIFAMLNKQRKVKEMQDQKQVWLGRGLGPLMK